MESDSKITRRRMLTGVGTSLVMLTVPDMIARGGSLASMSSIAGIEDPAKKAIAQQPGQ
ncbi:hypothetical protein ACTJJB_08430 [Chitinophaga sp. 22536]|uniref:hypothetical protein n=1 Tax=unclassified Chitinophaga TaxID=2619133 RepID=UPI003F8290CA